MDGPLKALAQLREGLERALGFIRARRKNGSTMEPKLRAQLIEWEQHLEGLLRETVAAAQSGLAATPMLVAGLLSRAGQALWGFTQFAQRALGGMGQMAIEGAKEGAQQGAKLAIQGAKGAGNLAEGLKGIANQALEGAMDGAKQGAKGALKGLKDVAAAVTGPGQEPPSPEASPWSKILRGKGPQQAPGAEQGMPLGTEQGMPPGAEQGMPPGAEQQMPPGMEQGMPPEMEQGMPPGAEQQMPPGMEQGMPPGMEQGMPPGAEQQMPPGTEQQMPPGTEQQMPPGPEQQMPPGTELVMPPGEEAPRAPGAQPGAARRRERGLFPPGTPVPEQGMVPGVVPPPETGAVPPVGGPGTGAAARPTPVPLGEPVPIGGHELPPLPYAYNALEPYIDEQTMRLHHDKHHLSYVNGLNRAEKALAEARRSGDYALVKHWERELAFHGAGHYLHSLFWKTMAPKGGGRPTGELARLIDRDFGSFDLFQQHFSKAAQEVEGGGWAILVWAPRARRLQILQAEKHQNLSQQDIIPLLPLDVWEHSYYLKYNDRRADYIKNWWNVVNWPMVARRLASAVQVQWPPA